MHTSSLGGADGVLVSSISHSDVVAASGSQGLVVDGAPSGSQPAEAGLLWRAPAALRKDQPAFVDPPPQGFTGWRSFIRCAFVCAEEVGVGRCFVAAFSIQEYIVDEIGVLSPSQMQVDELVAGEVGYVAASIRSVADARVGDTITNAAKKAETALPGYQEATPMVFCGLFPVDADQFTELRDALEKLQLNDAALKYEPESSTAMGFGFRCGFLGLLHMEIVQERLEREYSLNLITTAPSVVYRVLCLNNSVVECSNPSELPDPAKRLAIEEPFVNIEMITPKDYIGPLMELAQERRGEFKEMKYITENRASVTYILPLAEMVGDFFDQLKSRSKGYASMEYSLCGYHKSDLVRLDILINGEAVDPLAAIVHKDKDSLRDPYFLGRHIELTREICKLLEVRSQFSHHASASYQISKEDRINKDFFVINRERPAGSTVRAISKADRINKNFFVINRERPARSTMRAIWDDSDVLRNDPDHALAIGSDFCEDLFTAEVVTLEAFTVGRALTQKLKELIPRQMFKIPIQASIGSRVVASEAISAIRKDVLAKCYGGDISRKKKLLKKQAEGKKRMKSQSAWMWHCLILCTQKQLCSRLRCTDDAILR
ncbi:hypothetical protein L7F22_027785 [Adiantum nelumboides]|nr:hypothetical protein [Adiantum nelumboides]